jgi:hypothetical protein
VRSNNAQQWRVKFTTTTHIDNKEEQNSIYKKTQKNNVSKHNQTNKNTKKIKKWDKIKITMRLYLKSELKLWRRNVKEGGDTT